ncbi:MAG: hypothetical protein WC979_09915 [Candidatus Pacearchaeota archaeon]|jgi:hypothetical protein
MNTEINKKIEEAKREIEYWENLIKKIGMRWDYSFESEALAKGKGRLKGLEEAKKSYEDEIPRRPYKNQKKKDIELCNAYQKGLIDGRKEQKENELKELTGNPTGLDQFIEWKQDDVKRVLIKKYDEMKKKIVNKTPIKEYYGGENPNFKDDWEKRYNEDKERLKPFKKGFFSHHYICGILYDKEFIYSIERDSELRSHSDLIFVVEKLKDKASGDYAELKIVEIPKDTDYTISDYDGMESVEEVHRSWN